jgi:ABC-type amino acid transport/signal transduction systems, periplasmic component/domain
MMRAFRAFATFALVAAMPQHAASRQMIDVGVEDAAAPWSQADGTGYANDLVRAAFDAVDIDVRFHVLPYARCKQQVLHGALAACVSMSPAPELRGPVRFSAMPLFVFTSRIFENPRRPLGRRIEDFPRAIRVGTVLGYEYPPEMLQRLARRGAILDPAPTEETNLRKLAARRIDAAVVNSDVVKSSDWVAERAGVTGRVRPVLSIGRMPAYIGFGTAHRENRALADRFDLGYARIIASGERARIEHRWVGRGLASGSP